MDDHRRSHVHGLREHVASADYIVDPGAAAVGGDGTILKALHSAATTRTPVMGVAYGSLGALAAVPENELHQALDRFAAGDWFAHDLSALELAAGDTHLGWAINDVVLARR